MHRQIASAMLSAEALGMTRGALMKLRALAQPCPLALPRFDAAHGMAFDVEGAHCCRARLIVHGGKHAASVTVP